MNFLKKIFSRTILIISLLLMIYTFYKSEIHWKGEIRDYYFTYYVISSSLIIFSIVTFFISQKIKEYLIISVISVVVTLYLFEGYLIFGQFSKEQPSKEQLLKEQLYKEQLYEKQTGKKWDRRTKFEIYEDIKKVNNEIVVIVPPKFYLNENNLIFPLSGISNSETFRQCNENGYYPTYKSDRYGFNNPDEEWDKKEIEYLLIGDSQTHGQCVNRPNDIGSVLRTLSNKSVLNLGYAGNGPLIEFVTLREYLNSNIKKVLWVYYEGNDLGGLKIESGNNILNNYLNDLTFTQNLKFRQNEIDDMATNIIEIEKNRNKKERKEIEREERAKKDREKNFYKLANLRFLIFSLRNSQPEEVQGPKFARILELAKDLTNENNSKLYFVYLPTYSRYKSKFNNTNYNLVKNIVNELNIPFIDIHKEVFEKEENPLKLFPFQLPGHYNVEGYKKISETIYKFTSN